MKSEDVGLDSEYVTLFTQIRSLFYFQLQHYVKWSIPQIFKIFGELITEMTSIQRCEFISGLFVDQFERASETT